MLMRVVAIMLLLSAGIAAEAISYSFVCKATLSRLVISFTKGIRATQASPLLRPLLLCVHRLSDAAFLHLFAINIGKGAAEIRQ